MRRSLVALVLTLLLPLPALAGQVTVKPGETLSEIAERLGVSLSALMKLNGITKADHVEVGQVLKVPGGSGSGGGSGAVATGSVRVKEGDTLSEIADRQGMSLTQLMALNGLSKADHIEVGQVLKVSGRAPQAAASYARGASSHVVKPGESLSQIAEGYGVPLSRLVAINQLDDPDHVEIGRRLKLQGSAPASRPSAAPAAAAPARPAPKPERLAASTASATTSPRSVQGTEARAAEPAVTRATQAAATTPQPIADRVASQASGAARPVAVATVPTSSATAANQPASRPISTATAMASPAASAFRSTPASTTSTVTTLRNVSTTAVSTASRSSTVPAAAAAPATGAAIPGDWRRYGPLQVDWSGWQPMGGSLVAPVMNAKGDTLYLAINCGARKLNATSAAGDWRTWDNPQAEFELKLVNDLCRSRST